MSAPPIYDTPFDLAQYPSLAFAIQLVQAAPSRAAAVLRVLRERNGPLNAVTLKLLRRVLRQRVRIPKGDIRFVGGCLRVQFIEKCSHAFALYPRVF